MSDATSDTTDATIADDEDFDAQNMLADAYESSDDEADPAGAEALGDPGKRALDAMKAERKELKRQLRELREALEAAQRSAQKEGEPTAEDIRREAEKAAAEKANARIVRSEVRAAATGKLADPNDALTFLDLTQFDVDEDGNVDADEIAEAIDELLKKKPYLAATVKRFQGTADQGAISNGTRPAQLTREQLKGMSPEQINKARKEGRLNRLLGIEQ
ncbi:MAG: hypothetical protein IRZ03_08500 [Acidobacterium ailaaui]|nr:hypothetical protein [Pseudacidobacterium ailaaui]